MVKKFHGVDLHKHYATISVRDADGKELYCITKCMDFKGYIEKLSSEDAVVIESVSNSFYYSDEIEKKGAQCFIIDSFKFKIISESWQKTDRKDSSSLSLALWVSMTSHEFSLPVIYKPPMVVRELRRLFSLYQLINKQIRQYKNVIQADLLEVGIVLSDSEKERLLNPKSGLAIFEKLELTHVTKICILMNLYLLWNIFDQKEIVKREIYKAAEPLNEKVKLLITIKGVSPLLAMAFLSDIGDIERFKTVRKFNAYLGVVPTVKSSGGKTRMGNINRHSRSLSRSLFCQSLIHFADASPELGNFYESIKMRRGCGRSRIALLRKVFSMMRRMLLSGEEFRWKDEIVYQNKMYDYEMEMHRLKNMTRAG